MRPLIIRAAFWRAAMMRSAGVLVLCGIHPVPFAEGKVIDWLR